MDRLASVEIHLDHFRPKSGVRRWPSAETIAELGLTYDFETGEESAALGYRLLAYHPLNYAAACGTCNSPLKADCFPIGGGARMLDGADPALMGNEEPLVIYPIGEIDEDPEALIRFVGFVPVSVAAVDGPEGRRARVTIDLFRLGPDQGRDDLIGERSVIIRPLYHHLVSVADADSTTERHHFAAREIGRLTSTASPHTNCARSFVRLFAQDRALAREVYLRCDEYVSGRLK
jgi:hypothetical protein